MDRSRTKKPYSISDQTNEQKKKVFNEERIV